MTVNAYVYSEKFKLEFWKATSTSTGGQICFSRQFVACPAIALYDIFFAFQRASTVLAISD
jgi:hypothetical protein